MASACPSVIIKDVRGTLVLVRARIDGDCRDGRVRVSWNMFELNMPFVSHATKVEYVRRRREVLHTYASSEKNMVDLSQCFLPPPFNSFYLI